jgi:RHS repeat-associated protein
MPPGLPVEKYIDARPVESLSWRSLLQLSTYRDHRSGVRMQFHYTGQGRLPQAVTVQDARGAANYLLGYDQVGSLKAVAAMDGEGEGRVVKLVDYDSFGNVLADSNPGLFLPLAFAGGLRDRFTGLVRFGHRDYDPAVGRFTAPDPLGDTGGDHDLYDYCVDEPIGRVDPEGTLFSELWSLFGFADENKEQGKREEKAATTWEKANEARNSGDDGKAVDLYESMPDILTNSTVRGGGKVGAAGMRVILKSRPWGKATPSQ